MTDTQNYHDQDDVIGFCGDFRHPYGCRDDRPVTDSPVEGDRYLGGDPDDAATVIKVTGPNTAVLRFDSDAAFCKQHSLPATRSDAEFDLTHFKKI
jgi:hypothetical protein